MPSRDQVTLGVEVIVDGGVASAIVLVFASAVVPDRLAAAGRPGLSAVHFAGVGCGIAVSAVFVAGLAAAGYGWRVLWLFNGAVALLSLGTVAWLVPKEADDSRPTASSQAGRTAG